MRGQKRAQKCTHMHGCHLLLTNVPNDPLEIGQSSQQPVLELDIFLEIHIKRTSHHLQKKNQFKKITDLIGYILLLEKYCRKMKRQATYWKKVYPKHIPDTLYVYYMPNPQCILKRTCILNNVNPMTEIKGLISFNICGRGR